ncbi:YcxB family protein [Actinokineospora bangkokensis]|nr:YcxB family protein [Actinokineospora bangkokensis]
MRLRWEPVPADWSDGVRAVLPFARWVPWFAAALGVFSAVLLVLGQVLPAVFGLCCAVLIGALPPFAAWSAFRRDPIAGRVITAEVDERSLRMMTLDGTAYSVVEFAGLAGWRETERSFVLATGGSAFHVVPGRAFASTEDIDAFRGLLTAALGAR